jgi:Flp pilus assembly protein TadG
MLFTCREKAVRRNQGQALVEITLIFPLLVMLVGAAVDWGLAFFVSHVVQNAAREATRTAVTQTSISKPAIDAKVQAIIPNTPLFSSFRDAANITVTGPSGSCPNQEVTVEISGSFNFIFLRLVNTFIGAFPASVSIARSSTMRWERQPVTCP